MVSSQSFAAVSEDMPGVTFKTWLAESQHKKNIAPENNAHNAGARLRMRRECRDFRF